MTDECRQLSTDFLARRGWRELEGAMVWDDEGPVARVLWAMAQLPGGGSALVIAYNLDDEAISDTIPLELAPTAPQGRVRWWFHCPGCSARVAKLYRPIVWYRPPVRRNFRCRRCHALGYRTELGTPAVLRWLAARYPDLAL
ncbi:MAG: hypothetical protein ACHQZR_00405 [Candidatus Limnocylindrales bacterium]